MIVWMPNLHMADAVTQQSRDRHDGNRCRLADFVPLDWSLRLSRKYRCLISFHFRCPRTGVGRNSRVDAEINPDNARTERIQVA
jgi:hypothetical protein